MSTDCSLTALETFTAHTTLQLSAKATARGHGRKLSPGNRLKQRCIEVATGMRCSHGVTGSCHSHGSGRSVLSLTAVASSRASGPSHQAKRGPNAGDARILLLRRIFLMHTVHIVCGSRAHRLCRGPRTLGRGSCPGLEQDATQCCCERCALLRLMTPAGTARAVSRDSDLRLRLRLRLMTVRLSQAQRLGGLL
jgi:hypothetical protein